MASEKIFISYSRKDQAHVLNLVDHIEKSIGIKCWIDIEGIASGELFADNIIAAIQNADVVLMMVSANSAESEYVRKEYTYSKKLNKKIVPIVLEGDQLVGWFDFEFGLTDYIVSSKDQHIQKLMRNLRSWLVDEINNQIPEVVPSEPVQSVQPIRKQDLNLLDIKEIRQGANSGDNECQYLLGLRYLKGSDGLKENSSHAVMWLNKAASAGNVSAQYSLGEYYEGNSRYDKALQWYRMASGLGHSGATLRLGYMYEMGRGVSNDPKLALEYYSKALEMGEPQAKEYYDMLAGAAIVSILRIQIQLVESEGDKPVVRFTVRMKGENLKGYQLRCLITFRPADSYSYSLEIDRVPSDLVYKGTFGMYEQFSPDKEGEVINDFCFNIPCRALSEYNRKGEPLVAAIKILRNEGDEFINLAQKDKKFVLIAHKRLFSRKESYELQK
jgi:tetratricopeptide (TPR) repeat protein